MITQWVTSGEVIARIIRNTRLKDESYFEDIQEWTAEAILKLKTRYRLELKCVTRKIDFCQVKLPCAIEALAAVMYCGQRILPSMSDGPLLGDIHMGGDTSFDNQFSSVLCAPCTPEDMTETSVNNWPEYVQSSALVASAPIHTGVRYRVNYNKLEVGANEGEVTIYYWTIPLDETGFPMIPDNEYYKTAIYWYVRSMLIGAGFPDKVFSFAHCDAQWREYASIALNDINYPTVDEVEESLIIKNRLVDIGTGWGTFFTAGKEGSYDY